MQLRRITVAVICAFAVALFALGVSSGYDLYSEPHIVKNGDEYTVSGLSFIKVKGVFAPFATEFTYKIYGTQNELLYTLTDYTNGTESYINVTLTSQQVNGGRPYSVKTEVKPHIRNIWAVTAGAIIALLSIAAFAVNEIIYRKTKDSEWREKNARKVNVWLKRITAATICVAGAAVLFTGVIKPTYEIKDSLGITIDGDTANIAGTVYLQTNGCYRPDYVYYNVRIFDENDNVINEVNISTAESVKNISYNHAISSKGYPARIEVSADKIEYTLMDGAIFFGTLTAAAGIVAFALNEVFYRKNKEREE